MLKIKIKILHKSNTFSDRNAIFQENLMKESRLLISYILQLFFFLCQRAGKKLENYADEFL